MNILITGGTGMVGSQIQFGVKPKREELDILNTESVKKTFEKYNPEVLLHLAGLIDMKKCEEFPELAYTLNVQGTLNLAQVCRENNVRFVYVSSGTVFDGDKKEPYLENDIPSPLNIYARTKWLGELIVQDLCSDSLIVRTGWLFGGGEVDKRFIKQFILKLKTGEKIQATDDRFGSPTYVPDLLSKIQELIENSDKGIIHVVNEGRVSYFEVAKRINELGGFDGEIEAINTPSNDYPKRSAMEALVSQRVKMRPYYEAINDYLIILK